VLTTDRHRIDPAQISNRGLRRTDRRRSAFDLACDRRIASPRASCHIDYPLRPVARQLAPRFTGRGGWLVNHSGAFGQSVGVSDAADERAVVGSVTDPAAFAEVFERHHEAVRRYLVRRLGGAGDDLAAEVFVRAYAARSRFDPERGAVRPWLFGFAANVVRHHRRDERRRLASLARMPPAAEADDSDLAATAATAADRAVLVGALLRLSRTDRETLLLYVWGGLTYAEVATALGVPVGTVRSRISRARSRIRRELSKPGREEAEATSDPPENTWRLA
jgi:RNA polymerase sigma-70 factor (ECF subfamily)